MYDPHENKLVPVENEVLLTPEQRNWTRFHENEVLLIKGVPFRVHEIGETRIVLKLVKQ